MSENPSFAALILRVRAGDASAAAELLREYEPIVRRVVRLRLRNPRLRRMVDESDVCQSVFASLFVRAALGQYDLDTPEQLLKLLTTMARNKLTNQARKEQAGRRDHRRVEPVGPEAQDLVAPGPSPSEQLALVELVQKCRDSLSPDERRLADLRSQGQEWAGIASQLGGSPEALRKQLARAASRVAREVGLEEAPDE
jgi:RNA polymerase sigma-70 factor (ECF subfamily)